MHFGGGDYATRVQEDYEKQIERRKPKTCTIPNNRTAVGIGTRPIVNSLFRYVRVLNYCSTDRATILFTVARPAACEITLILITTKQNAKRFFFFFYIRPHLLQVDFTSVQQQMLIRSYTQPRTRTYFPSTLSTFHFYTVFHLSYSSCWVVHAVRMKLVRYDIKRRTQNKLYLCLL